MSSPGKSNLGMFGAVGSAVAASACCTIPLALVSLGAGGAWIGSFKAMEPYRPWFIGLAVLSLGYAGLREYRRSKLPECECEEGVSKTTRRTLLAVGLVVSGLLIASPWIIRSTAAYDQIHPQAELAQTSEIILEVQGMTCAACPITVSHALTNLNGVESAVVTFEPPQAVVRYNPDLVTVKDMEVATSNVGYPAELKSNKP